MSLQTDHSRDSQSIGQRGSPSSDSLPIQRWHRCLHTFHTLANDGNITADSCHLMGLFRRRINARVREQVKRIFSTTTGSETGDMSQASEQVESLHKALGQNVPLIIKVDTKNISPVFDASPSKHACTSETAKSSKQILPRKRQTDPFEGERSVLKSRADSLSRPSELGDIKFPSRLRRIRHPPLSSFPFCNDGQYPSSPSHSFNWRSKRNNVCRSYSETHQGAERDWKRLNKNCSLERSRRDIYPWSGNKPTINLCEKQKIKPKHPHNRTRHNEEEPLPIGTIQQVPCFTYKQNLPRRVVHLNERQLFSAQKQRADVSGVKPSRVCDFYQVRQPAFQIDQENNRLKRDANENWRVNSPLMDTSTGIFKIKNTVANQRSAMRNQKKSLKLGFAVHYNDYWNGTGFQQTQNSSQYELEQVAVVHNSGCGRFPS